MTTKEDVLEQVESFGIELDDLQKDTLDEVEDYESFGEWLEKTNGQFWRTQGLYVLPNDMKVTEETVKKITPWDGWCNYEPHDPPRFTCPVCGEDFIQVEVSDPEYAGYGAVNQFTGHLTEVRGCGDSSGAMYNETGDEEVMCGDCSSEIRREQPSGESTIRIFLPDENDAKFYFKNGVRFDVGAEVPRYTEYRNLPKYLREAVSDVVSGKEVRNMNKTSSQTQGFNRSFTRRGFNQFVHSLVHDPNPDYPYDFPLMAVGKIRNGYEIAGGYLYTPDLISCEGAKEEVEEWVNEERINEFRRDRMR